MDLDGYAVGHGIGDLRELPLDRFVNFVWWWATHGMEKKDRDTFEQRVYMPPKGVVPEKGPWTAEAETQGLMGLKRSLSR